MNRIFLLLFCFSVIWASPSRLLQTLPGSSTGPGLLGSMSSTRVPRATSDDSPQASTTSTSQRPPESASVHPEPSSSASKPSPSSSASVNTQLYNRVLKLNYQALDVNYFPGWISHPREGFVLSTTMAGENVKLVLDFLNKETFVPYNDPSGSQSSGSNFAITCTPANFGICRHYKMKVYTDQIYNRGWNGFGGDVSFMGIGTLTLSMVTTPVNRWYYRDGFGQLSLGPGSNFWEWLKINAKPSEEYYITFDYNCDPKLSVDSDLSTPEKVSKICKDSKVTLGAPKPDSPMVPLEGRVSQKDSGNKYYTWIATGISAEVP